MDVNIFLCKTADDVSVVIDFLKRLCSTSPSDHESILQSSDTDFLTQAQIWISTSEITFYNSNDESNAWKYLSLLFYLTFCLDNTFTQKNELDCLSVQQTKDLKDAVGAIIDIGVLSNLNPTLLQRKTQNTAASLSEFDYYKRLAGSINAICICFKSTLLKSLLITNYLKPILLSFYQLIYCPFKKPNVENNELQGFVMTPQIYAKLIKDRDNFKHMFKNFVSTVHPMIYIRETMLLLDKSSPTWLKRSLSNTLSVIIRKPNGVQNVVWAMLDSVGLDELDDSTKSWKILLPLANIIMDTCKLPDFKENICSQLCEILKLRSKSGEPYKPFERLFALCTMLLHQFNPVLCQEVLINNILSSFVQFTNDTKETFDRIVIDSNIEQMVRVCYYISAENNFNIPVVPVKSIVSVFNVFFYLYMVLSSKSKIKDDVKHIFLSYLTAVELHEKYKVFGTFLFGFPHADIHEVHKELEFCVENNEIVVKRQTYSVRVSLLNRSDAISELIKDNLNIKTIFYSYLLNCLSNKDTCPDRDSSSLYLLELEDSPVLQEGPERKIVVHKLLTELSSDLSIQTEICKTPGVVTKYISTVLQHCVAHEIHKTMEFDSDSYQTLFLLVMLLQVFSTGDISQTRSQFVCVVDHLKLIKEECSNLELQELCNQVLINLESKQHIPKNATISELDVALEDICDPLLPVRGHALMTLTKLVQKRNQEAMERKQYILNIFMQNLKNDDSFIYLSAIGGLAAMGDVFPDTVLNILADEYVDFSRKSSEDGNELRMKLGEILVRITKLLGEMAPKYKSILLNIFLEVAKDEDHLIRASSLSNLGEVCKVLGYKLGTIVTEVLVCVHSVISTDKAPEPRRAAVTVLRQLFEGLQKEMIVFLKDEILPIYRTLKNIYYYDKDDIMRLQAQLALEQLNQNMRVFVFPNPQLHTEKKIIMLN